jgi:hypothetical protein
MKNCVFLALSASPSIILLTDEVSTRYLVTALAKNNRFTLRSLVIFLSRGVYSSGIAIKASRIEKVIFQAC